MVPHVFEQTMVRDHTWICCLPRVPCVGSEGVKTEGIP